ncbi:MAG: hypothetical protein E7234_06050 [Lachnospiraceae bacterium]|nr:hypothetical protein [Lachnospiraceae bacterium]
MRLYTCKSCGAETAEEICPECIKAAKGNQREIETAEELRDIAKVLSITSDTDSNIKKAVEGILNIAERMEKDK